MLVGHLCLSILGNWRPDGSDFKRPRWFNSCCGEFPLEFTKPGIPCSTQARAIKTEPVHVDPVPRHAHAIRKAATGVKVVHAPEKPRAPESWRSRLMPSGCHNREYRCTQCGRAHAQRRSKRPRPAPGAESKQTRHRRNAPQNPRRFTQTLCSRRGHHCLFRKRSRPRWQRKKR